MNARDLLGLAVAAGVLAGSLLRGAPPADVGPQSPAVDLSRYAEVRYVDVASGSDLTGDGSRAKPWASLPHALEQANPGPANSPERRTAVLMSRGRYLQPTFALKARVDLYGGFASPGGARDVFAHATVLDGGEAQRIALGADQVRVDGLHFVHGRVRGKGAAIFCDGTSPVIANCVFAENRTLAPRPWLPEQLHETAHDGGAVYAANGSSLRVEHCLFVDNTTECGRGGAVAASRARPVIVASVFVNNRAGLDDPMRSSDGGAISLFDHCRGEVSGCVISANAALARNDAGGVFVALWSAPRIADNVFTANDAGDDAGALFIGGQEHRYGVPLDPVPPADQFAVAVERNVFVGNSNGAKNSGATRVTMESRARFVDNVIAENQGGFYLQRSEVVAERNTVWQDWRFVEDKPTLGPSVLAGNILKGPLGGPVEGRVTLRRNLAEPALGGDTLPVTDVFENDGATGRIAAVRFHPATATTVVTLAEPLGTKSLRPGRVVGFSQGKNVRWRVLKTLGREGREAVVWGRLETETKSPESLVVLRSFTLRRDAPDGVGARVN